jgi:phage terminase large subunit-like protein
MSNPIIEYHKLIESGNVIVGDKIKRIYKKLVADLDDTESEYEYSSKRALHPIEFIERFCKHSKGKWAGQPIVLELWQKAMFAAAFGFIHKIDGTRKYQEVLLIVARKNGKSTIGSGIGLYLMVGDNEGGPEVYAVATKRDQAKLVWLESKKMVKKSPILLKSIKPLVAEMTAEWNESSFKPLGSDSETLDGLNVHGAIMDEIHAWKDKNLYDVIVDGTSTRDQPMIFNITTAGTVRESVYDMKYEESELLLNGFDDKDGYKNDRLLPIIYELDKREEWTNPDMWVKANPGLGTIKKRDQLETKVNKAKANPMLVKNLITKDFNIRDTSSEAWLTFEQINNTSTFDIQALKPRYAVGGADLSSSVDLTSANILFQLPNDPIIYVKHMYWLPEDLLERRAAEDNIPYDLWRDAGWLRTTPGNKVHYKFVVDWFREMQEEYDVYIPWTGYDSWSATYFVEEMQGSFGKESMIPVIQGKKTLSAPMKSLGADLDSKKINYGNNPITKWCLTNTSIDIDKNNNIQPAKGNNQRKRIDGLASMLNSYVILHDKQADYQNLI